MRSIGAAASRPGAGKARVDVGHGVATSAAEALDEPARQRARRRHRDLLAEHGAHRELEAVDAARQAQARSPGRPTSVAAIVSGAASRSSQRRTAAMTAPLAGPSAGANDSRTRGASVAKRASSQPAVAPTTPARDAAPDRPSARRDLDARDRALGEEGEQGIDVVRRAVAERHRDRIGARRTGVAGVARAVARCVARRRAAQPRRVHAVAADEGGVEAAQAAKAARQRDLRDRHLRVGEELLGEQQAARLQVLQRRDAVLGEEDAAQVAVADAEPGGDRRRRSARRRRRRTRRARSPPGARACATRPSPSTPGPGRARSRAGTSGRAGTPPPRPAPASRRSGSCAAPACARGRSAGNRRPSTSRRRRAGRRSARRAREAPGRRRRHRSSWLELWRSPLDDSPFPDMCRRVSWRSDLRGAARVSMNLSAANGINLRMRGSIVSHVPGPWAGGAYPQAQ